MTARAAVTCVCVVVTVALSTATSSAQPQDRVPQSRIPLVQGLTMVSALRFPEGDRENVVTVQDATPAGVSYRWRLREHRGGGKEQVAELNRFVRRADLAGAPRLNTVYFSGDQSETPGYTAFTLSTAAYDDVSAGREIAYGYTMLDGPDGFAAMGLARRIFSSRALFKGKLSRVSPTPTPFPLLVNGVRVSVPVLALRGRFALRNDHVDIDFWVLADRAHPLLLKIVTGTDVLQVVRVEVPVASAAADLEAALTTRCGAELPGVYFAFNSAELEPASEPAIADAKRLVERHPEWNLAIEGHTDSIGGAAANQALSLRRAESVRAALLRSGVAPSRVRAAGFGASRPRESNATLEGRASNRRVELARPCPAGAAR
jgi:outer membrane protein OmpA-like peptidoglycan-associated protein